MPPLEDSQDPEDETKRRESKSHKETTQILENNLTFNFQYSTFDTRHHAPLFIQGKGVGRVTLLFPSLKYHIREKGVGRVILLVPTLK